MLPTTLPAWQALAEHRRATAHLHLRERFAAEPNRFQRIHACSTTAKTSLAKTLSICSAAWPTNPARPNCAAKCMPAEKSI